MPEKNDEVSISTQCSHIFHKHCIYEWLKRNGTCPCCRCRMIPEEVNVNKNAVRYQSSLEEDVSSLERYFPEQAPELLDPLFCMFFF